MSLDTYEGLIAEVALLLNKTNLNAQIPSFIRLFEAQANRRIKHYRMQAVQTFTLDGSPRSLPCGFKGVEAFKAGDYAMTYATPDMLDDIRDCNGAWNGAPLYYSIVGDRIIFSPSAGEHDAVMRYWQGIQSLGDTQRCNWLLEENPDVYLYGAALQAAPYLRDDDRINMWRTFVEEAYASINADSIESQFGAHAEVQVRSVA